MWWRPTWTSCAELSCVWPSDGMPLVGGSCVLQLPSAMFHCKVRQSPPLGHIVWLGMSDGVHDDNLPDRVLLVKRSYHPVPSRNELWACHRYKSVRCDAPNRCTMLHRVVGCRVVCNWSLLCVHILVASGNVSCQRSMCHQHPTGVLVWGVHRSVGQERVSNTPPHLWGHTPGQILPASLTRSGV